jgi:hypothetical protein
MSAPNFELITELQVCLRRDFALADPTLLKPLSALPLIDGEWMELNGSYQLARATGATAAAFPIHTERGRYDTQAIGKANVIFAGNYEAETSVIEGAIGTFTVGAMVKLAAVTAGANTGRVGLKVCAGAGGKPVSGDVVVGIVTKTNATTNKVRFLHASTHLVP